MDIKLPLITKAKLVITERCQLRCKYCYEHPGTKDMSLDTAKRIIDTVVENAKKENKVPEVTFFGGEPLLLYEEIMKPCIEYIRNELKVRCTLGFTTNGLLLDEDKLKYLRSMNVPFMLSIDGCKEAHNTNRVYKNGRGSFSKIEKLIPLILKYFPSTMARMTLTPDNLPYLYESVKYISEVGFQDMHIIPNLHISTGRDWVDSDFDVAREQLSLISKYVIDTFEGGDIPLVFRTLADMFPRIVLASYSKKVSHHRVATCCSPIHRCGIGVRDNAIFDTEGNIFACQHHSTEVSDDNIMYLGNLETGAIEERRLKLLEMNQGEMRSQSLVCSDCPLYDVCTGGCAPNNLSLTGEFTVLPESYCRWTQELYNSALDIIKHFDKDQNNILFKDYFYGVVNRGVICVC